VLTRGPRKKRVLVVDDSLTVRELERKLLTNGGYEVEVAVDGMDGWNAIRTGKFDLVVTDVDMPRMDGIELVTLVKQDPNVKSLPVMIVSYKDRPEDRERRAAGGRRLLSRQEQLSGPDAPERRRRPDRHGGAMRIGIVNDMPMAVEVLRRALSLRSAASHCMGCTRRRTCGGHVRAGHAGSRLDGPGDAGDRWCRGDEKNHGQYAVRILIVTASVDGNTAGVFDAMGRGAIDAVDTPILGATGRKWAPRLFCRRSTRSPNSSERGASSLMRRPLATHGSIAQAGRLVAIGASAGGPMALKRVLCGFTEEFRGGDRDRSARR